MRKTTYLFLLVLGLFVLTSPFYSTGTASAAPATHGVAYRFAIPASAFKSLTCTPGYYHALFVAYINDPDGNGELGNLALNADGCGWTQAEIRITNVTLNSYTSLIVASSNQTIAQSHGGYDEDTATIHINTGYTAMWATGLIENYNGHNASRGTGTGNGYQ